jgi:tRNA G10  N-methylase Trm11
MGTYFDDPGSQSWTLPESLQDDDVRLSEDVIERYIKRFTKEGDVVFDPFAGFGTVLVVAEQLGRIGIGCELLEDRATYASSLVPRGRVRIGDVRTIDLSDVRARLIISSPPYMNRGDPEDPLAGYETPVRSYARYIDELASIYVGLAEILEPDGRLVVQLQNLRNERGVTALVFDLHSAIGSDLRFEGEEITTWDKTCYGYTHGYCLIYAPA